MKRFILVYMLAVFVQFVDAGEIFPAVQGGTNDSPDAAYEQLELLGEVIMHIRRHYVDEKDFVEIFDGALKGMLGALDPHSAFLDEQTLKEMEDDTHGSFGGIGIQLGFRNGILSVIAPIEDTPAFRAGLHAGDRIVEIDGQKTADMTLREAVNLLRGPKGEPVTVRLQRDGREEAWDVTIVRDEIDVKSVKGACLLRSGIGYIRLTQFSQPSGGEMLEALAELEQQGLQALILDLRNNPGGLLNSAVEITQIFLPRDALIVTTRGRSGVVDQHEKRSANKDHKDWPLVVLVNGGSASAAEIVAGALKDNNRAILLGDTTFGKGSVQSVIRLRERENVAIRLTTAYYYTPAGTLIHDRGIEPDIKEPVPTADWIKVIQQRARKENPDLYKHLPEEHEVEDIQLERALDLLEGVLVFMSRQ